VTAINVPELGNCRDRIGDLPYTIWIGYQCPLLPGMTFQRRSQKDEHITKIRLSVPFAGMLPGGWQIDMQKTQVRDLVKWYPNFFEWRFDLCANYFTFSNDTLTFLIKKDTSSSEDINYYLHQPIAAIDIVAGCGTRAKPTAHLAPMKIWVDSMPSNMFAFQFIRPSDIGSTNIYKYTANYVSHGPADTTPTIFVETKEFVYNRAWRLLRGRSEKFKQLFPNPISDKADSIIYIINGYPIQDENIHLLAGLRDSNLKSVDVFDMDKDTKIISCNSRTKLVILITTNDYRKVKRKRK